MHINQDNAGKIIHVLEDVPGFNKLWLSVAPSTQVEVITLLNSIEFDSGNTVTLLNQERQVIMPNASQDNIICTGDGNEINVKRRITSRQLNSVKSW